MNQAGGEDAAEGGAPRKMPTTTAGERTLQRGERTAAGGCTIWKGATELNFALSVFETVERRGEKRRRRGAMMVENSAAASATGKTGEGGRRR